MLERVRRVARKTKPCTTQSSAYLDTVSDLEQLPTYVGKRLGEYVPIDFFWTPAFGQIMFGQLIRHRRHFRTNYFRTFVATHPLYLRRQSSCFWRNGNKTWENFVLIFCSFEGKKYNF